MEKKLAYNIVFSNHIDNEKSAQQVGLGYHEVFGLVQWPKKQRYMPVLAPYSRFWAILSCFFGDYFFWAIEPAQKLHGTLDPLAAHLFCY